jgi:hypothetical protein
MSKVSGLVSRCLGGYPCVWLIDLGQDSQPIELGAEYTRIT